MADTLITGTTIIEDKRSEKGEVWSCRGAEFHPRQPDIDDVNYETDGGNLEFTGAGIFAICPISLPQGVTITGVIVYSNVSTENWTMYREELNSGAAGEAIASAALNTEDTTITQPIVNNNDFGYMISTVGMDAGDKIYGARITYEF